MSIPTKVSNGRLIRQLELWGYTKGKVRGDRVVYTPPMPALDPVTVMQAHVHKGNSTPALRLVYEAVTSGNANLFWARNAPANVPVEDAIDATIGRHVEEVAAAVHANRIKFDTTDSVPTPQAKEEAMPEPVTTDPASPRKQVRGASSKVLQYMHDHPHDTVTAGLIGRRIGMDAGTVGGALAHLCNLGHVERLVRGTYRLNANLAADKTVRHEHSGAVAVPKAAMASQAVATVTPITQSMVPSHPVHVPVAEGDDLDALLELVLPQDYEFRPSHLRAMQKWQTATAELLAVLRGES